MKVLLQRSLKAKPGSRYLTASFSHNSPHPVVLLWRFHSGPAPARPAADKSAGCMVMELYPNIRLKACLDLALMREGRPSHPRIPGCGFTVNSGPLFDVQRLRSVSILNIGAPAGFKLKVSGFRLSSKPQASGPLGKSAPLLDALGQSTRHSWAGKSSELPPAQGLLKPRAYPLRAPGKSWKVEKRGGAYWLVSPFGERIFSAGINCVRPHAGGPVQGMERLHALIPPKRGPLSGAWLDEMKGNLSFYTLNLIRRHGPRLWKRRWAADAVARLQRWGFNTIGNWSDPAAYAPRGLYYTLNAAGWDDPRPAGDGPWGLYLGFPDVFSPAFARRCEAQAKKIARPGDPLLMGYFVLNEPPWQRENFHLAKLALATQLAPHSKAALRAWLRRKRGGAEAVPRAADWERMRELLVDKYFSVVCGALRRRDPNHLLLGIRFYGLPPQFLLAAMRHMDVVSLNNYEMAPNRALLGSLHRATGKPLLLGEFHMGAAARGMHTGLVGVKDDAGRGQGYAHYMQQAAAIPYCVGAHWFQYVDQPVLGRFDGENYNIGLVDVSDRPYPALAAAAAECNPRLAAIHSGRVKPDAPAPLPAPSGYLW